MGPALIVGKPRFHYPSVLGWYTRGDGDGGVEGAVTSPFGGGTPYDALPRPASAGATPSRGEYAYNVVTPADYRFAAIYSNTRESIMDTVRRQGAALKRHANEAVDGRFHSPHTPAPPAPRTPARPATAGGAPGRGPGGASGSRARTLRPASPLKRVPDFPSDGVDLMRTFMSPRQPPPPAAAAGAAAPPPPAAPAGSVAAGVAEMAALAGETQQSLIERETAALAEASRDIVLPWRQDGWDAAALMAASDDTDSPWDDGSGDARGW